VAIIAAWLAAIHPYWIKLAAVFLMGIILELFSVVQSSLITTLGPVKTYGKRGSAFEAILTVGDLLAPLILGVGLDAVGFSNLAFSVGVVAVILAIMFYLRRSKG
jgi:predicted MFS family arabinose efflux permease